ncbi:hypothetical protein EIK77_002365 [Talaromyces pinophilus]|nr:hypothetical protein EIK77_002365 [Talaromyces pinophilus]
MAATTSMDDPAPGMPGLASNIVIGSNASARIPRTLSGGSDTEGSEMLYTRLSEYGEKPDIVRSAEGGRIIYLGPTFNLSYILHEILSPRGLPRRHPSLQRHFLIPSNIADSSQKPGYLNVDREDAEMLEAKGAFSLPDKGVSDALLATFLEIVHPTFPVFDIDAFTQQYATGKLSMLTLQAVYLVSSTICDESLLQQAGFENRVHARREYFKRVKALYDVDYEPDKVLVIIALLHMSFCWSSPIDDKDMYHWIGCAVALAQAKGLHRA